MENLSEEEQALFGVAPMDVPLSEDEHSVEPIDQVTQLEPTDTSGPPGSPTWPLMTATQDPVIPMTQTEPVWFATPAAETNAEESSS